jgi:serine/threonine-protein kinase
VSPPSAFGPYRVLHQIGSGVLGPVFRAYDSQTDRLVAVKAFSLDLVPEVSSRVAETCAALIEMPHAHPAIVRVVDAGLEGSTPYVALEYASGDALDVFLRQTRGLPIDRALAVLAPLAEALDAAWAQGAGHGALHPRDIFVGLGPDDLRVTGIGIAQALERAGVTVPLRRPHAAPERLEGRSWDVRADVYSLAVIAGELIAVRSPGVDEVLARGQAEAPEARFESASAFVQALAQVAADEPADAALLPPAPAPKRTPRPRRARTAALDAPLLPGVGDDASALPDESSVPELTLHPVEDPTPVASLAMDSTEMPAPALAPAPAPEEPPRFPWAATGAVAFAGLVLGMVIGYQIGVGRGRDAAIAEVVNATAAVPAPVSPAAAVPEPAPEAAAPPPKASPAVAVGRIVIQSEPSGALAYIDGRRVGTTPVTAQDVPLGGHDVRVTRSGYAPAEERVTLTADARSRTVRVRLRRGSSGAAEPVIGTGSLEVDSRPRGARVTVDGRPVGQTPVRVPELSPGDHKVLIELAGHRPVSSTVKVVAGEQTRLAVRLEQGGTAPVGVRERR